jgi:YrbI family 3-deoxy-D-manno-octulosonate 8-phosphate phosphatase
MKKISIKASKIKVVLTDVDGVLTDGGMYYSTRGDIMKKFHVRDGMGVTLLRKNNIPSIIVTKEKNEIVKQWSTKMKIDKLLMGIIKKETILKKICKDYSVNPSEVCYIGDDINDLGLLKLVGLSVTPSDGIVEAQKTCDYVCKNKGGYGVFREVANMILLSQKVKL